MKKNILLISIGIVLIIILLLTLKKEDNIFEKDGIMFAVVVDGEDSSTFPTRGKYHIDIECENGDGSWIPETWELSITNITGKVSCNVMFTTILNSDYNNTLANQIENSVGTSGSGSIVNESDAGYRYEGKNPNNYIWFNNEMWRIIGSIPVCLTANCGNSDTKLVKIIRNQTIGGISYDAKNTSESGEWGSNSLYTLLNNYYYGKNDATGNEYCYGYGNKAAAFCDYSYIGIGSSTGDYYGSMVESVYWNTGKSTYSSNATDLYTSEKAKQTISGKVGLMAASDYGFASNYGRNNLASYGNTNYTGSNWLYGKGNEMTSIQYTDGGFLHVNTSGSIVNEETMVGYGFRPVVYLKSSVYIVSGNGTEENPYQIAK